MNGIAVETDGEVVPCNEPVQSGQKHKLENNEESEERTPKGEDYFTKIETATAGSGVSTARK